jgi:hypothetical protein
VISNASGSYFDITGPNGNALNNAIDIGMFSTTSQVFLRSGESATLASVFPDTSGYAELLSMTVDTASIPEPGAWSLIGSGFAGLMALRFWRSRKTRTN